MMSVILTGKTAKEIGTTYALVRHILKNKSDTRSDDTILIAYVQKFCKDNDIPMPSHETITRARRKIQNTDRLFQANEKTKERRNQKEKEFKDHYSKSS